MTHLKEIITVKRPIEDVFRYTADFSNIEQWDPGVSESRKITPGSVNIGTEYHLKLRYGIITTQMSYSVRSYDPPYQVVLQGRGESFTVTDTITFEKKDEHTKITYQADLDFRGVSAYLEPFIKNKLEAIGQNAMEGLKKAFTHNFPVPQGAISDVLADKSVIFGLRSFTRDGYTRSKKRFNPMPVSLSGKTAVVTGATSGIGYAAARRLAELGARVIIVARNSEKADQTLHNIIAHTGNDNIGIFLGDMSLMQQVNALAENLIKHEPEIHILVNNAGALFNDHQFTAEGFERAFAVDLLAPFLLTTRLIPKLSASAPARIINVSSGGMYTQKIHVDDLNFEKTPYDGPKAYARAKRGLVILTEIWAETLRQKGIVVNAMHPGWVDTPGIQNALPGFVNLTKNKLRTPEQGADTIVWLAAAPEASKISGKFWLDRRPHTTHVLPGTKESVQERNRFWDTMHQLIE